MNSLSTLPPWYWAVMGALLGGTVASFLGVVLERVPRGLRVNGRSRCVCGRQLLWYENVPVFGWLRIGGTTSCCTQQLPRAYLFGEISGMLGLGILGVLTGPLGIGLGVVVAIAVTTILAYLRRERGARPPVGNSGR